MSIISCSVFIATSVDGYIAKPDGSTDWLHNEEYSIAGEDFGYEHFMTQVDALIMGRKTFETVLTFPDWPYAKPVVVLTDSGIQIPVHLKEKVIGMNGAPDHILKELEARGWNSFYIDGGITISEFLSYGKITNIIITQIPILLGDGVPLFQKINKEIHLELKDSRSFSNGFVQTTYTVKS